MHVLLVATESYAVGAAVTIQTLLASTTGTVDQNENSSASLPTMGSGTAAATVHITIVDVELTADTRSRFQQIVDAHNKSSYTVNSRLQEEENYALYLDCDTLILQDAHLLVAEAVCAFKAYESLSGTGSDRQRQPLLAAVQDFGLPYGHTHLEEHPLYKHDNANSFNQKGYFNAGLLVYNLKAWRAAASEIQTMLPQLGFNIRLDKSGASVTLLPYGDQDALNIISHNLGGWVALQLKWNVQGAGTYLMDRTRPSGAHQPALFPSQQAAEQVLANPGVIHFTGPASLSASQLLNSYVKPPSKPWSAICLNPYTKRWYQALDDTPWAGWRPSQRDLAAATAQELKCLADQLDEGHRLGGLAAGVDRGTPPSAGDSARFVCCGRFDKAEFLSDVAAQLLQYPGKAEGDRENNCPCQLAALAGAG
eukprot:gene2299-2608_t